MGSFVPLTRGRLAPNPQVPSTCLTWPSRPICTIRLPTWVTDEIEAQIAYQLLRRWMEVFTLYYGPTELSCLSLAWGGGFKQSWGELLYRSCQVVRRADSYRYPFPTNSSFFGG